MELLTLYLDACSLQRPMDAPDPAVSAEAGCVHMIVDAVRRGDVRLVSSSLLEAEVLGPEVPDVRRIWAASVLELAHDRISVTGALEARARAIAETLNLAAADALHAACAEQSQAALVTVDRRRFLNRVRRNPTVVGVEVVDPFTAASWIRSKRK